MSETVTPKPETPPTALEGKTSKKRTAAEVEAELDLTRERLVGNVDQLKAYLKPANLMQRQVAKVKGIVVDEQGGIRVERVAGAAAVVVGVFVLGAVLRRRRRD